MNNKTLTLGDTLQGILNNSYGILADDGLNSFVFDLPQNTVKVTRRLAGWHPQIIVEVDGAVIWSVSLAKGDLKDDRIGLFFSNAHEKMRDIESTGREMTLNKFYRLF